MNFHMASRGVTIKFDFPAGGSCLNCSNKIIFEKNFNARFARSCFVNWVLLFPFFAFLLFPTVS